MSELDERLHSVIKARSAQAASLDATVAAWSALAMQLRDLAGAVAELAAHPGAPPGANLVRPSLESLPLRIELDVLPRLRRVQQRFSRSTLNIGVAGEARVGKSTLLQSLSGLGDGQIPTGDNLPVTAVRSRILHVPHGGRARLGFHTWQSFRELVLQPYFDRLEWGSVPDAPAAFRSARLPEVSTDDQHAETLKGMRERVLGMQASLDTYLPYLTGESKTLQLDELRPFVAYPTAAEEQDRTRAAERRYLAVREAVIECDFPGVDVRNIGLIDLPGTGEIVAAGEDRHIAGLEDEVDLVLLVTNPKKKAYWGAEAARTLDIVRKARCGADAGDFCALVVNVGGASAEQISALVGDIEGKTGGTYRIIQTDAIDAAKVRSELMLPLLHHLAERLPAMDEAARKYAVADVGGLHSEILATLDALGSVIAEGVPASTPTQVVLVKLAEELRGNIAVRMHDLVHELLAHSRGREAEDEQFAAAVDACYNQVRAWLNDGLGRTEALWLRDAERTLKLNKGSGELIDSELNRIRVHVASQFSALDDQLSTKVESLWSRVAEIVAPEFGLPHAPPVASLGTLRERLRAAGCTAMVRALDELLATRLGYRTHFHPRMRRELDVLTPQVVDPESGEERARIVVAASDEGASEALRLLREHGERAAYEAYRALLKELTLPALVLHAAAEQFDDTFVRSGSAEEEFLRMALAHRDQIWPGRFEDLDRAHRLFAACAENLVKAGEVARSAYGGRK